MKKAITLFTLFVLQISFLMPLMAQEFFICNSNNELHKVQSTDCTSQLKARLGFTFNDITFHPSGKLYGIRSTGALYELDTLTGSGLLVATLPTTTGTPTFNSLSCNAQGVIYATGIGGGLFTYTPQTQRINSIGTISVNGTAISASGDLTFYKGDLYVASARTLVKIDLSNPANSSNFMNFNITSDIFGIVSFVDCGIVTTYATSADRLSKVYKIDWPNRVLVNICQTTSWIFGGASRYEFIASNVLVDTTRATIYTCDKSREGLLPPRIVPNQRGCDSVVIENWVFVKKDTTRFLETTCNPQLVRSDTVRFQNFRGCDSVVISETKIGNDSIPKSWRMCQGDSFNFYNQWLRQTGRYFKNFRNATGCDSVIALQLTVLDKQTVVKDSFVCQQNRVGRDSVLLQSFYGCDSLSVQNRLIAPRINEKTPISWQICRGDTAKIGNFRFYTEGSFSPILKNQYGCDSTINLTLQLLRRDTTTVRPETCDPKKVKDSLIVLTNQVGCDSFIVIKPKLIQNQNSINNLPAKAEIVIGDSLQLLPQLNFNASLIQWTPPLSVSCTNCAAVFTRVSKSTKLRFFATDAKDCAVQQDITLLVNPNRRVYIPNVFSPNDDNVNDVFAIQGDANLVLVLSLKIFDRWGEMVYSGTHLKPNTEGWNGRFKGTALSPDVFVFWARLRFKNGDEVNYQGDVTLIK